MHIVKDPRLLQVNRATWLGVLCCVLCSDESSIEILYLYVNLFFTKCIDNIYTSRFRGPANKKPALGGYEGVKKPVSV